MKATIRWRADRKRWCVDWKKNGKRVQELFKTKTQAELRVEEIGEYGTARVLTSENREDYVLAIGILKDAGYYGSLSGFVRAAIASGLTPITKAISIELAVEEYITSKERVGRRDATLRELGTRLRAFSQQFKINVSDLKKCDIEHYCTNPKWSPRTCRNVLTCVGAFLKWCKHRSYLSFDPQFDRASILPKELKKAKPVFSVDEMEAFFNLLTKKHRSIIPFYAVQAFCGLRNAEAAKINWQNVNFKDKTITLQAEITKTGDEYTLRDLPENLWVWLATFQQTNWRVPDKKEEWQIHQQVGWKRNGLRHTFATMHVSLFQNPAKTSLVLRHRNQQRLWQNYLANPVSQEDARRYFEIVPK